MCKPNHWLLYLSAFFLLSCTPQASETEVLPVDPAPEPDIVSVDKVPSVSKTGKVFPAFQFEDVLYQQNLDSFSMPIITADLMKALQYQLRLLKTRRAPQHNRVGSLQFEKEQMEYVVRLLMEWENAYPHELFQYLDAYQLKGKDGRGNVYFTGYYTPVLEASKTQSKTYPYPIYKYPRNWVGPLPTRKQIDGPQKALSGRGLELAFTKRLEDIYFMQVQGSGFVEYPDGQHQYLAYDGTNRQPYRSIGRFLMKSDFLEKGGSVSMSGIKRFIAKNPALRDTILFHNPSYTFFHDKGDKPLGAGTVPLTGMISIAVDPDYIPLGSVLLAAVPIINEEGNVERHEYKILLAQDVGGQIKGPGHIDYYCGTGQKGQQTASKHHHYGRLWLLLPKPQT
jgi:membrane-bound lytic murein transglycosylase A